MLSVTCYCKEGYSGKYCQDEEGCDLSEILKCAYETRSFPITQITNPCDWKDMICGDIRDAYECMESNSLTCGPFEMMFVTPLIRQTRSFHEQCLEGTVPEDIFLDDFACYKCEEEFMDSNCTDYEVCTAEQQYCYINEDIKANGDFVYTKGCTDSCTPGWNTALQRFTVCCNSFMCNGELPANLGGDQDVCDEGPEELQCHMVSLSSCFTKFLSVYYFEFLKVNPDVGHVCGALHTLKTCINISYAGCSGGLKTVIDVIVGHFESQLEPFCEEPCYVAVAQGCVYAVYDQLAGALLNISNILDLPQFCGSFHAMLSCLEYNLMGCDTVQTTTLTLIQSQVELIVGDECPNPCEDEPCMNGGTCIIR
jgi:hypothetical protein